MAFPWKLLARLVSPRRQERQEHDSADDVKPDVLAIAKPTESVASNGLNTADPPVDEKPVVYEQSEAVSADPDHTVDTASSLYGKADSEDAGPAQAADPALSVARDAGTPLQNGEGATRTRRKLAKSAEPVETVLPPSPAAPAVLDDTISLDEEIKLLRDQLARKLRLQNAQLKRMLERFER